MRRITFWALSTLSALALLFGYHTSTSGPLATSAAGSGRSSSFSASAPLTTGASGGSGSGGNATGSGSATPDSSSQGTRRAARTVTGQVAETRWGPVQVQVKVRGSRISDVAVLQYPNGNGTDQQINSYALPILTQETIQAQSASIDMVSGATYTSGGYLQSLQSALDQVGL